MSYPSSIVANSLLQRGFREARPDLTPMKLQKLAFFLQGWMLAIYGRPALNERFCAWKYGPVVPNLYNRLRSYGSGPITKYIDDFDPATQTSRPLVVGAADADFQKALDVTWEKYIGISALSLSAMTHQANSPWELARRNGGDGEIANELIQQYFVEQANAQFQHAAA